MKRLVYEMFKNSDEEGFTIPQLSSMSLMSSICFCFKLFAIYCHMWQRQTSSRHIWEAWIREYLTFLLENDQRSSSVINSYINSCKQISCPLSNTFINILCSTSCSQSQSLTLPPLTNLWRLQVAHTWFKISTRHLPNVSKNLCWWIK